VHATEDDVWRVRPRGSLLGQFEAVARHIGELDDLVALVVVAKDEDAVTELSLGGTGAFDQARVRGSRKLTGAFDAPFGGEVAPPSEDEKRQGGVTQLFRCDAHTEIVVAEPAWQVAPCGGWAACGLSFGRAVKGNR